MWRLRHIFTLVIVVLATLIDWVDVAVAVNAREEAPRLSGKVCACSRQSQEESVCVFLIFFFLL